MKVWINGRVEELSDRSTVRDAVRTIGINDPRGIAVAVDEEVVQAGLWDDVVLSEGQRLEVLRAVQGGVA